MLFFDTGSATMKYTLVLKTAAQSRTNTMEANSGPVFLYEVGGLPEGQVISIRNIRPEGQVPVWQIGTHVFGQPTKWIGAFGTAEDALAQLQAEIDMAGKVGDI